MARLSRPPGARRPAVTRDERTTRFGKRAPNSGSQANRLTPPRDKARPGAGARSSRHRSEPLDFTIRGKQETLRRIELTPALPNQPLIRDLSGRAQAKSAKHH